jgi:hypothetical protein
MSLTPAEVCAVALIMFGLFLWLGIFMKLRAVLALLAAVGLGGWLGRALVTVAGWLQWAVGSITGWLPGAALPAALFVALAVILTHDLHPRSKRGASRRTGWVALAVGALLVAGVEGMPALAPLAAMLRSLPAAIASTL